MWFWEIVLTAILILDLIFVGADTEMYFRDGTVFRVNDHPILKYVALGILAFTLASLVITAIWYV